MKSYNGKAPIYQLWSEKDFAFDTMELSWQARLLYRGLLQAAWLLSTRPDLPDNDAQLRNILGGIPESIWNEHREAVRSMFQSDTVNGVAVLWQKRLREDWATLEDKRRKRTDAANSRWESQNEKSAAKTEAKQSKDEEEKRSKEVCITDAMQTESKSNAIASPTIPTSAPRLTGEESPDPSLKASQGNSKPEDKDIEQVIVGVVKACGKPPNLSDVKPLLSEFSPSLIVKVFAEYVENLGDDEDRRKAEFLFFRNDDGLAARALCHARQQQAKEA